DLDTIFEEKSVINLSSRLSPPFRFICKKYVLYISGSINITVFRGSDTCSESTKSLRFTKQPFTLGTSFACSKFINNFYSAPFSQFPHQLLYWTSSMSSRTRCDR